MSHKNFTVMIAGMAKAGMEAYIRKNLVDMMEHSRQHPGCIVYNIHESISIPGEFMVYMLWKDQAAFENHNQRPEIQEFKKKLAPEWFEQQSPKTYWSLLE